MGVAMQRHLLISLFAILLLLLTSAARAEPRTALVIGNAAYQSAPVLKTPIVDAEIVAETLRAANFDVTEMHDVCQAEIGQVMRTFLDKLAAKWIRRRRVLLFLRLRRASER